MPQEGWVEWGALEVEVEGVSPRTERMPHDGWVECGALVVEVDGVSPRKCAAPLRSGRAAARLITYPA